jgi:hypothetical protein
METKYQDLERCCSLKKLYYVPLIHGQMDLGSLGVDVSRRGKAITGEERWKYHRETVSSFWEAVEDYFRGVDASGLKIYQDGIMTGGELGMNIAKKVAADGSENFNLVLELVDRGALLMKTESEEFLITEYQRLLDLAKADSLVKKSMAFMKYRMGKRDLTKKRDAFIATAINGTLEEGERGVLFLGAYHEIEPMLSSDVEVVSIKEREKLLDYMKEFAVGRDERRLKELAEYVASPVEVP